MLQVNVDGYEGGLRQVGRRELLRAGALGFGSLALPQLLDIEALQAASPAPSLPRKAKSVVILFLSGGPAQQDMWDLKPNAPEEVRGTFLPISTNVPGIQISEHMPRMASLMNHCAIVRSVHHTTTSHPAACYWMMVGSRIARPTAESNRLSRADRPHVGSALTKVLGKVSGMPSSVMVPEMIQPNGPPRSGQFAGFLGAAYDPYLVHSDPNLADYSPGAVLPLAGNSGERLRDRQRLLGQYSREARHLAHSATVRDFGLYHQKASELITSPAARKAFDIAAESTQTRDRYGRHVFGQSTLLARRLIEAGVRLVHVNWVRHDGGKGSQGYDSHRDHLNWAKNELLPPTDAAFSSLVEDLHERGLLDETLVVMMGEFGRTPKFNANGGRDHWSRCFSVVMAGGGIGGGQVYGSSDKIAAYPVDNPVTPDDLMATLYTAMGIDPHNTMLHDLQNRPYRLTEGAPIGALLS